MSRNAFTIDFDVKAILAEASRLEAFSGPDLGRAVVEIVNRETADFQRKLIEKMVAEVMLDAGYISSKIDFKPAVDPNNIIASIVAAGDTTILGRYSPVVLHQPANPLRSKGDPKRGIPAGSKAAGVRVTVKRGVPKTLPGGFTMTLRAGKQAGEKVGVFVRHGERVEHLYSLSPYSMLRYRLERDTEGFIDELSTDVLDTLVDRYERTING